MKDIKLKLLSELMKNSRVSDREMAKVLGVSQPTASRMRAKLEKEGIIKEYTIVPDFTKLGFEIMAISFFKLNHALSKEETAKIRGLADEVIKKAPFALLLAAEGIGCGADRVLITFHRSYTSYSEFIELAKHNPTAELYGFDSFLINLSSKDHYLPLTFAKTADYLMRRKEEKP